MTNASSGSVRHNSLMFLQHDDGREHRRHKRGSAVAQFIGAFDQGTTGTRFMVFDRSGAVFSSHYVEHLQVLPRPGWVEHDPAEIWRNARDAYWAALSKGALSPADLAAVGVTNQRETTVVWNRRTGHPLHNAIVWQDTRTDSAAATLEREDMGALIAGRTGLRVASYFSALKLQWLLGNVEGLRTLAENGDAMFGTIDSWLVWNLTGGVNGGLHITDATNASRTMLMDLESLKWDGELTELFGIPIKLLPDIESSAHPTNLGQLRLDGSQGTPIASVLGDQQAAAVGHLCLRPGQVKNTYGTGNFVLLNTGQTATRSTNGLLTTVAFKFGDEAPSYALEGSVAATGSAVQWLRDGLGLIQQAADIEDLAATVPDSAGLCFVPAFSGLYAPRWRPDARGALVGLSRFHTKAHIARAVLEAIGYQSLDVVAAMERDSGQILTAMCVDGGITVNNLAMQIQADILDIPVERPGVVETTALGAAYAAGLAVGFWSGVDELASLNQDTQRWYPAWDSVKRTEGLKQWALAVEKSLGWIEQQ